MHHPSARRGVIFATERNYKVVSRKIAVSKVAAVGSLHAWEDTGEKRPFVTGITERRMR
jgi:hypothetical protein